MIEILQGLLIGASAGLVLCVLIIGGYEWLRNR